MGDFVSSVSVVEVSSTTVSEAEFFLRDVRFVAGLAVADVSDFVEVAESADIRLGVADFFVDELVFVGLIASAFGRGSASGSSPTFKSPTVVIAIFTS